MTQAWQIERALELELDALEERRHRLSNAEFNEQHREIMRDFRDEMDAARHEAMEAAREYFEGGCYW